MDFNKKLQQLRTKNNLTQEQLAEKVCVSRVAVSKWESGRGYPNLDSLKLLAKVFNITIDELLSSEELIDIAQVQVKNKSSVMRTMIFGITDFMVSLLFVIPVFANRFEDKVVNVSILHLTEGAFFNRIFFLILIVVTSVFGVVELALQNIQSKTKQKIELIFSGLFSSLGIVFSALANQPYTSVFFFSLFIIKVLITIKSYNSSFGNF